jgi:hypothetical protein
VILSIIYAVQIHAYTKYYSASAKMESNKVPPWSAYSARTVQFLSILDIIMFLYCVWCIVKGIAPSFAKLANNKRKESRGLLIRRGIIGLIALPSSVLSSRLTFNYHQWQTSLVLVLLQASVRKILCHIVFFKTRGLLKTSVLGSGGRSSVVPIERWVCKETANGHARMDGGPRWEWRKIAGMQGGQYGGRRRSTPHVAWNGSLRLKSAPVPSLRSAEDSQLHPHSRLAYCSPRE